MRTLYVRPALCPVDWPGCTPIAASPLLAELIGYLEQRGLGPGQRAHAETLLVDLLQPVPMTTIEVRMPAENPARQVAQALADNPADNRSMAEWGREVGASLRGWRNSRTWLRPARRRPGFVAPVAGPVPCGHLPFT